MVAIGMSYKKKLEKINQKKKDNEKKKSKLTQKKKTYLQLKQHILMHCLSYGGDGHIC